jgi:glycosyltransferase involved in cell wall biosynthesis
MKFNIITRCSRVNNLDKVQSSIFQNWNGDIKWHILFDTTRLKDISADLLARLNNPKIQLHFVTGNGTDYLYPQISDLAKTFDDGFVAIVDDDNVVHNDFFSEVSNEIEASDGTQRIFVVNQYVGGKDFTGLQIREAKPENMKYQGVDIAQLIFHHSVFTQYDFTGHYAGDGILIDKIFAENPQWFSYIPKELCYYNHLETTPTAKVPKVLLINKGPHAPLKSYKVADYEDDSLLTLQLQDDTDIEKTIVSFKPDSIVTISDDWKNFPNLANQPLSVRNKWITLPKIDSNTGQQAYQCAMETMLRMDNSQLVSYFTPIYNTGDKLLNTYKSLKEQTHNNWEWVMVNDSTDGGKTLKIAEEIAKNDSRVKVYDFREKSGGIIGESKYRAATLCRGYLLAELDHDDYLTPDCTYYLHKASQEHSEIGFFYTDNVECDENWNSLKYPDGFAFGYGKYEKYEVNGFNFDSCIAPPINPKTIRHIVGVPNHIRAWRRDVYFKIGGHNRDLAIADDYELLVRTFLGTLMMRIPKMCYIQFIYNNTTGRNTHDLSRADIQRRVRTIMHHYNERIAKRFQELGLDDYCYRLNPNNPLDVPSNIGENENNAHKIYNV